MAMEKISVITTLKQITLENVKVSFKVKLLQYQLNNIIFKYNNKYAFDAFVVCFKEQISELMTNSSLKNEAEAKELFEKARALYKTLNEYKFNATQEEINEAVDNTLKYLLFQYTQNKNNMGLIEQYQFLLELKIIKQIINHYKVKQTDRIVNALRLLEQLRVIIKEQI